MFDISTIVQSTAILHNTVKTTTPFIDATVNNMLW